ncbi:hypothetical protein FA95DRAFT_1560602 [Auriscalpium vulgare]|uniref:Uncharacterized protein n=1 Tax=Auriscalpium vulgare TaxID=40419 RepID=A0ACB8RQZ5_9AGAM|nr:hypothetical protein FA95DRAFT_1560602 [Auriscalpium vulgare]
MAAPEGHVAKSSHYTELWSETMRSVITQLVELPPLPPDSVCTTPDGLAIAERAILDAREALHAQVQVQETAIAFALQDLFNACAERDAAIGARLLTIRHQHNSRLPAIRLPPEVLTIIFTYLSSAFEAGSHVWEDDDSPVDLRWLAITHVCRRWRQIALEYPLLWTYIDFSYGRECLETFLSRAKRAPLSIVSGKPLTANERRFIAQNIGRTRALTVKSSSDVFTTLNEPATLLEDFELMLFSSAAQLPGDLFGRSAPALRHLQLVTPCLLPWKSSLLTELTSLSLRRDDNEFFGFTPLHEVLNALGRMHALEKLDLDLEMAPEDPLRHEASDSRRIVSLTSLRRLDLFTDLSVARIFYAHIALPSQVVVRCKLNPCDGPMEDIPAVFSNLLASIGPDAHSSSKEPIKIVKLSIQENEDPAAHNGWAIEVIAWRESEDKDDEPVIHICLGDGIGPDRAAVVSTLKALSYGNLEMLFIASGAGDVAWMEVVGNAPKLWYVSAEGKIASALCDALRPSNTNEAETPVDDSPRVFLPALSSLQLSNLFLTGVDGSLVETLPMYLAERARLGYMVKELDIQWCEEDEACVGRIRDALPGGMVVTWDEGRNADELLERSDGQLPGGILSSHMCTYCA